MFQYSQISVVVQGPRDKRTPQCLASIRKYLPGAHIIFSTWEGTKVDDLDYDELLLNEDPGGFVYYYNYGSYTHNINRQILSTLNGLKKVKTTYALKLRADNYLTSNNFLYLFRDYQARHKSCAILKRRVVNCTWYARKPNLAKPYPYHPSDLFFFGLTEDLINIWDLPLCTDEEAYYFKDRPHPGVLDKELMFQYVPEQHIWINFLRKNGIDVLCQHFANISPSMRKQSELSIINNLLLAAPIDVGFATPKHEPTMTFDMKRSLYSWLQWRFLYYKYCEPTVRKPLLRMRLCVDELLFPAAIFILFFKRVLTKVFPYSRVIYRLLKRHSSEVLKEKNT